MMRMIFWPMLAAAAPVLAAPPLDLAAIDAEIAAFTGAQQGDPGGAAMKVDRRLRLAACAQPHALSWYGSRRDTVLVECPVPGGWRLFVPLRAARPSASAAPAILRGDAVTISVAGEGFAVSQPGEALESGAVGIWIKVRTLSAKAETLRARVLHPGVVGMELP